MAPPFIRNNKYFSKKEILSFSLKLMVISPSNRSGTKRDFLLREKKEELQKQKRDEEGLHLLTLLLQCAEAVSADNFDYASKILLKISKQSTLFGTSAQRVTAYFSEAMSTLLMSSCLGIYATMEVMAK
ncbi:hypothetical protein CsatB_003342 [Cannabis sativa]